MVLQHSKLESTLLCAKSFALSRKHAGEEAVVDVEWYQWCRAGFGFTWI